MRARVRLLMVVLVLLCAAGYLAVAMVLIPWQLRREAARAGLEVSFQPAVGLDPRTLRMDHVVVTWASGSSLAARRLIVDPLWRTLFTSEPPIESAQLEHAELHLGTARLGPFEARLRLNATSQPRSVGWLALEGRSLTLATPAWSAELDLLGHLHAAHWGYDGGALRIDVQEGVLEASRVDVRRAGAPALARSSLQGMLRLESGTVWVGRQLSLVGRLHVSGPDAGLVLDLLGADEAVRLMFSALSGQAFELEAALRACSSGVELRQVRIQSGIHAAEGALHVDRSGRRGAILLRRGSLSMGVAVRGDRVDAELTPDPLWLPAAVTRLDDACAPTAS